MKNLTFQIAILLSLGLILIATSSAISRKRQERYESISDEGFLSEYTKRFQVYGSDIIAIRYYIADIFHVQADKLKVDMKISDIKNITGFLGEFELGIDEILDEVEDEIAYNEKITDLSITIGEIINLIDMKESRLGGRFRAGGLYE
ncbi:MAG: hypothetical protein RML57_10315 [Acidobacteriota bacterium]|nr:hypothetical protein [Acidobacteriota bacterium]